MPVDFMYIGASRAGSSYLYATLREHPQIYFPIGKPVRYWNRHIDGGEAIGQPHRYKIWTPKYYYRLYNSRPNKITGDITDGYTQIPEERIQQIKDENPDCKILYAIRDPYSTIISHLGLKAKYNQEVIDKKILLAKLAAENSYWKNNIDHAGNIKRWRNVFGEDNMLVYLYDDLNAEPKNTIKRICGFIGADPSRMDKLPDEKFEAKINARQKTYELSEDAWHWLRLLTTDNIRETQELIGRDLSHWLI